MDINNAHDIDIVKKRAIFSGRENSNESTTLFSARINSVVT